jgi:hypothetical protein
MHRLMLPIESSGTVRPGNAVCQWIQLTHPPAVIYAPTGTPIVGDRVVPEAISCTCCPVARLARVHTHGARCPSVGEWVLRLAHPS